MYIYLYMWWTKWTYAMHHLAHTEEVLTCRQLQNILGSSTCLSFIMSTVAHSASQFQVFNVRWVTHFRMFNVINEQFSALFDQIWVLMTVLLLIFQPFWPKEAVKSWKPQQFLGMHGSSVHRQGLKETLHGHITRGHLQHKNNRLRKSCWNPEGWPDDYNWQSLYGTFSGGSCSILALTHPGCSLSEGTSFPSVKTQAVQAEHHSSPGGATWSAARWRTSPRF